MKKQIIILLLLSSVFASRAQTLVSKTLIVSYSKSQIDSVLNAHGVPALLFTSRFGVDAYKIIYNTVDHDSTLKTASGLMAVPRGVDCQFGLINYGHGTTSLQEDVPSRLNGEGLVGLVSASNGYVMCEPDFLGMGDSQWPHYYLHAYTQAMSSIDLIRAVREACQQLNVTLSNDLYVTGYSQGGFSAMATHQYMETYFPNEFTVTKSFPGAGSYDMSGAMVDLMLSDVNYPSPGYLPFLLFTWNPIYHLFSNPSDYLKSPYDVTLPPLVDGLHGIDDFNDFMPDTPKLIFHQAVIDSFASNPNHPFRQALRANDVFRWVPQAPMLMVHCLNDRQVPIQNTRNAYNYFISHSAVDVDTIDLDPSLGHGDCGNIYLIYLKGFLDSVAGNNPCLAAAGLTAIDNEDFQLSPNPADEMLLIKLKKNFAADYEFSVVSLSGKTMLSEKIHKVSFVPEKRINLSELNPGIYVLQIRFRESLVAKRFAVIR